MSRRRRTAGDRKGPVPAAGRRALPRRLPAALIRLFLRLDSPAWQAVIASRWHLFPQVSTTAPRKGDALRYVVQALWLLVVRTPSASRPPRRVRVHAWVKRARLRAARLGQRCWRYGQHLPAQAWMERGTGYVARRVDRLGLVGRALAYIALGIVAARLAFLCITQPFDIREQAIFALCVWLAAMLIRRRRGRFALLLLVVLSATVSTRYLWWRYTFTLGWDNDRDWFFGLGLLAAETYAWLILILGFVQSVYPLERKPEPLPADTAEWPAVDLFIPTYNEDLAIVRDTVYGALGLDWPHAKLRIHILDDGGREAFRVFAGSVGVGYITRTEHQHAKAGNLNHALRKTSAPLIAVFDCDHIPTRSFLQMTVGWFLRDPRLALVQTPHHFLSSDPFERNLGASGIANEGELFYHRVQDGNDLWNAAFFCGSCAVLRRSALESVGGFAIETVTEDAHTALRMHRAGWNSAYLRIPLAAGLATDSLADHVNQRIRWARGMIQVFRTDNPLTGRGLTLLQRICYLNAMLHFLAGLPRLVFLTAPLAFLMLHAYIIRAPALLLALYFLPHVLHAAIANGRLYGRHRNLFLGEIYETVLAWYIAWPTTVALFAPRHGGFNVTAKGGRTDRDHFDWRIAAPYLTLAALNVAGLGFAAWRFLDGPVDERGTVVISGLWTLYNLLLIGVSVVVAREVRQVRATHRVPTPMAASLGLVNGHTIAGTLTDYSDGGAGFSARTPFDPEHGSRVTLFLQRGDREFAFAGRIVRRSRSGACGIEFDPMTQEQRIDFVSCTFGRADAWLDRRQARREDRLLKDLLDVFVLAMHGYGRMYRDLPRALRATLGLPWRTFRWLASFRPRNPLAHIEPPAPARLETPT